MIIRKLFRAEMAHAVPGAYTTRCHHLHGHSYKYEVFVRSDHANDSHMVIDFKALKESGLGDFFDSFDHAVMLWEKDPTSKLIQKINPKRHIVVPFVPTAEMMAKAFFTISHAILQSWPDASSNKHVEVTQVIVHETETGYAVFGRADVSNDQFPDIQFHRWKISAGIQKGWKNKTWFSRLRRTLQGIIIFLIFLSGYRFSIASGHVPVANAGFNQFVMERMEVQMDGSASTSSDRDPLKMTWVQVGGPEVFLNDVHSVSPTFTAPAVPKNIPATISFDLTVENSHRRFAIDTVYVVVRHLNVPPRVLAGHNRSVKEQEVVVLDGTETYDPERDKLQYIWNQVGGPVVRLSNPRGSQAIFTAPILPADQSVGRLRFQLFVTDGYSPWVAGQTEVMVTTNLALNGRLKANHASVAAQSMKQSRDSFDAFRRESDVMWAVDDDLLHAKEFFKKKEYNSVIRLCEKILILRPDNGETVELLKQTLEAQQGAIKAALKSAEEFFSHREYLQVIRQLHLAADTTPVNPEIQELMTVSLGALEKQAILLKKAPPQSEDARNNKERREDLSRQYYSEGLVSYSKGDVKEAATQWKKALESDRDNQFALNAYTHVQSELQNP